MKELKLIIYDEDYMYVNKFIEFFNKNYSSYFMIIGITSEEELNKYIKSGKTIDILLINKELIKQTSEINIIKVVITLDEELINNDLDNKHIFKYQNGHALFNCISKIYSQLISTGRFNSRLMEMKVLSFFSPVGGVGTSSISILFANSLIKQGYKVLLLDLQENSSLGMIFKDSSIKKCITDLFYKSSEKIEIDSEILKEFIIKDSRTSISYINPISSIIDLEVMKEENLIYIIDAIKKEMDFDYIIVDYSIAMDKSISFICNYSYKSFGIIDYSSISIYKMLNYLNEMVNSKNILLLVNKVKNENLILSDKLNNTFSNRTYDYISFDSNLDNYYLDLDILINSDLVNSSVNNLVYKFLREELVDE